MKETSRRVLRARDAMDMALWQRDRDGSPVRQASQGVAGRRFRACSHPWSRAVQA
ncbi:hypothetical protein AB0941_14225 [Streptomyces sp. NPDC013433]|uniref:hypothetical protein n=1 Tax=Streptomyces sp. NPDC013433 TaxID=3155604 RepID=UPI00345223D1